MKMEINLHNVEAVKRPGLENLHLFQTSTVLNILQTKHHECLHSVEILQIRQFGKFQKN
jgi:hypothetical protein